MWISRKLSEWVKRKWDEAKYQGWKLSIEKQLSRPSAFIFQLVVISRFDKVFESDGFDAVRIDFEKWKNELEERYKE